ncbi:hypothetical protein [Phocaeicola coprophilus]|uniref:hypothetical protein n=1 Tax=Phocaeicola coprophilus TaxID=387090 RepID=UPI0026DAB047|nr:hypothetical protein [Phocaeicola coprophilus]
MPYHIDEENSELAFEVREGNKLVIKIKSNIFSDSLELYLIKVGDNTEPTDKNVFSSLRVLKEIENLHDTILKEINSVTSGFWELKQDSQGNEYISTKYNVLTEGGLTTYGLGEQKLGTIYDGLPIDNDTIYWEEVEGSRVLKAKGSGGGSTGLDETKLWNVLGTPGDQQIDYSHLRSAFSQFSNKFVTINTEQEITALKHFTAGLSVGESKKKIYEENGVVYIDADVAVTGAMTFYASAGRSVSTIMDAVAVDGITIKKENNVLKAIAGAGSSFDENAMWSALSGSSDNQINKSHLTTALDGYATQNWVIENYATKSELSAVSNKLSDFLEGSDTDNIINKWKELEAFLSGMAETDNLAEILETKADRSYVDSTFVTLATKQTITGEKTFSSVLNTAAIKASGAITAPSLAASDWVTIAGIKLRKLEDGALMLEGNLALTGALTMYASNGQSFDTIYDGLPIDNDTIYWQEVDGSRVLKAREGSGSSFDKSAMWTALAGSTTEQINKSHLTTALDGYATQNRVIENYATKSELSAVSNKLSDFLEGSDTDNIINKWKELEAFLSGMAETDNLAEILETKADRSYVDSTFVTLATKQTITGEKTFSSVLNTAAIKASGAITAPSLAASDWVTIAGIKLRKLEDGALMLEGNLALTGALTMYASNGQSFDTIYDGLPIDNDTIYWQEVDGSRVLKAREGSGSSFDKSAMWTALAGSTTEQINKSHLTTALTGYATESWVSGKNYAVKATTLAGYGITDAPTKTGSGASGTWGINISGNASNADKLDGTHKRSGSTYWGVIPYVESDGTFEVGKYIDFHNSSTGTIDYSTRLQCDGDHSNTLILPTRNGNLALLSDNVASATKLQTARTIWGQSFDGTNNVTGNIDIGNNDIIGYAGARIIQNLGSNLGINPSGYVGIGTTSPSYKLHVNGGIYGSSDIRGARYILEDNTLTGLESSEMFTSNLSSIRYSSDGIYVNGGTFRPIIRWGDIVNGRGYQTRYVFGSVRDDANDWGRIFMAVSNNDAGTSTGCSFSIYGGGYVEIVGNLLVSGGATFYSSDIRYKSIMQQVELSLLSIANAPSFVYRWNRPNMNQNRLNLGGSAQYTQSVLPWAVEDNSNFLMMDYATVAYTFAVHTARHLLTYETRNDKKIKKLENRVKYLEKQLKKLGYEEVRTLDDSGI